MRYRVSVVLLILLFLSSCGYDSSTSTSSTEDAYHPEAEVEISNCSFYELEVITEYNDTYFYTYLLPEEKANLIVDVESYIIVNYYHEGDDWWYAYTYRLIDSEQWIGWYIY